jgi:hypothetical protein
MMKRYFLLSPIIVGHLFVLPMQAAQSKVQLTAQLISKKRRKIKKYVMSYKITCEIYVPNLLTASAPC